MNAAIWNLIFQGAAIALALIVEGWIARRIVFGKNHKEERRKLSI